MHMHAGFASEPVAFAQALDAAGVAVFSNTIAPAEYCELKSFLGGFRTLRLGVGMHPWWVDSDKADQLLDLIGETDFVGEVGLDFWPSHISSRNDQLIVFESAMQACASSGGKLISMHAVKAERELLDILEKTECIRRCTCILHSYGGPSDQLARAIAHGCLFSVGPRMLASKRGREYARIIPIDQLLVETDLPQNQGAPADAEDIASTIDDVTAHIALIRGCEKEALAQTVRSHAERLLAL